LRRADRLFDILRLLRAASRPVTAASLADELEVTVRTVYRVEPQTAGWREGGDYAVQPIPLRPASGGNV
jgi:hypothetical protein